MLLFFALFICLFIFLSKGFSRGSSRISTDLLITSANIGVCANCSFCFLYQFCAIVLYVMSRKADSFFFFFLFSNNYFGGHKAVHT